MAQSLNSSNALQTFANHTEQRLSAIQSKTLKMGRRPGSHRIDRHFRNTLNATIETLKVEVENRVPENFYSKIALEIDNKKNKV